MISNTRSPLHDVVIVSAVRTPIGSFRSSLASLTAPQLGAVAIKGALQPNVQVDEVIMGHVLSAGVGQAPAKQAAHGAGLPDSTICWTVNKVCSSGMKAIQSAALSIALGQSRTCIAGGMESMSNAPFLAMGARNGWPYGHQQLLDSCIQDGLWDARHSIHMGDCAEETAARFKLTREAQDAYATESYRRAAQAWSSGAFAKEIVPVEIKGKKGAVQTIQEDEEYKKVDFAKMPQLKPAFSPTGTITAANASTLNDGAAALLLMHDAEAARLGLKPLARIRGMADAELTPKEFTIAPSHAIPRALERAGVSKEEVARWEINEAFSAVSLANLQLLQLDPQKVNVQGGAVSLGHPIGCSGARIVVTLVHQLQPGQIGCAAVCNGGGGASALVIERLQ